MKDEFKVGDLLWRGWDLYRAYSGHLTTNWGAHTIDMVQYALGKDDTGPTKMFLNPKVSTAAIERDWNDKWNKKTPRPDAWETASRFRAVTFEYTDGTTLNMLPGVDAATFYGDRGRMVIGRNKFRADPPELVKAGPDPKIAEKWQGSGHVARPHLENWLDCVRTRGVPNAPVEVGHRAITVCHLANIAREVGRKLHWNPKTEQFTDDGAANQLLLDRPRRQGFELPESA